MNITMNQKQGWKVQLAKEKAILKKMNNGYIHKQFLQKWRTIKKISDEIYRLISPFEMEDRIEPGSFMNNLMPEREIELHNKNLGQKIFINPETLPQEVRDHFEDTLSFLLQNKIVSCENYEDVVQTTKPIREFFGGKILITDRTAFEEYHAALSKLYSQIQHDGEKRFPEEYASTGKTASSQKVENFKTKYKFPFKIPSGTKWENFIIKFLNEEEIHIEVGKIKHNATFKDMGFLGRTGPDVQWKLLKTLAEENGEVSFKNKSARDQYKKRKELLANKLNEYFAIDYDPFFPYKSSREKPGNSYKIKITLIPPPQEKKERIARALDENGDDDLGIREYLNEETPSIYKGSDFDNSKL
jgi:hypothetical protein